MPSLLADNLYSEDLERIAGLYDFSAIDGKTIMLSGATGMIGSFLVDLIMHVNCRSSNRIRIIALGRNSAKIGCSAWA